MFEDLKNYLIIILVIAVVIAGSSAIYFIVKCIRNYIDKKAFEKKYDFKVEKGIKVSKKQNEFDKNIYEINYPKWTYSNKDGSRNKVRNNNFLVFYYSFLYFSGFILKTKSPVQMIDLVRNLRNKYGDSIIEKNIQEKHKYTEVKRKKDLINKANEAQSLVDEFSDCPTDFEVFCAELFDKMGYDTKVTSKTNDGGYDIILKKDNKISIVECKCYGINHSIGRPLIQKLVGANQEVKADNMKFVTTSKFSKEAINFSNETNVELIDGNKLIELIDKYYEKTTRIIIQRSEWELNYSDLQRFYPPDVNVLN